eukprot:15110189-Heterocapsa_arctica.AAC.1
MGSTRQLRRPSWYAAIFRWRRRGRRDPSQYDLGREVTMMMKREDDEDEDDEDEISEAGSDDEDDEDAYALTKDDVRDELRAIANDPGIPDGEKRKRVIEAPLGTRTRTGT